MIKELRRKFVVVSVSIVMGVLLMLSVISGIANYIQIHQQSDIILDILIENDGKFPVITNILRKVSPEIPFSTRYFTVIADKEGDIQSVDIGNIRAVTKEQAIIYANEILVSNKDKGFLDEYKYKVVDKEYGTLMVFVDCSRELAVFRSFLFSSLPVFFMTIILVFVLALIFSKEATKSIVESYEKQKRFITDVTHELKTPLAVIRTNAEVIELYNEESQWTKNILNNTTRLSQLVDHLVTLTRMDEDNNKVVMTNFSLSDAIKESSEPFQGMAIANGKQLAIDVEDNLTFYGNEQSIRQLLGIFLENAMKYAVENSEIQLFLKLQGKKNIITIVNETENLLMGSQEILFERFYRADSSRNSKTGGYGIGLSIAKAIVLQHKGKISAQSPDGKLFIMTVIL